MLFLLDNGHGGVIDNNYVTPGKRSPQWNDGSRLYEGEFNRAVVNRIAEQLTRDQIPYVLIAPEQEDISLTVRVKRANAFSHRKSLFISVHANAGGGDGFEVFTSPGDTPSDEYATIMAQEFKTVFPNRKIRSEYWDGDVDKERSFYVLRKTKMPAIMTENFFMDNQRECKEILMTRLGRDMVAQYHINAIRVIFRNAVSRTVI